jgi:hypothetical protein
MPSITMTPVQSSQIQAIGHDPASNTLAIQFKSGKAPVYHYANVDGELFERFRTAESIGSFFYKTIKPHADKYPYTRAESVKDGTEKTHNAKGSEQQ